MFIVPSLSYEENTIREPLKKDTIVLRAVSGVYSELLDLDSRRDRYFLVVVLLLKKVALPLKIYFQA